MKCYPENSCVFIKNICDGEIHCLLSRDDEIVRVILQMPACLHMQRSMLCKPVFPKISITIPNILYNNLPQIEKLSVAIYRRRIYYYGDRRQFKTY